MTRSQAQFGSTTALVALAVVVSLGSATDVQAGAVLAQWRPEARAQVAGECEAVAQFLSRLGQVVRSLQCEPSTSCAVVEATSWRDELTRDVVGPRVSVEPVRHGLTPLPARLIDLPPPMTMR